MICSHCKRTLTYADAELDLAGNLICVDCYLANPPQADVDGVFAEIAARVMREDA